MTKPKSAKANPIMLASCSGRVEKPVIMLNAWRGGAGRGGAVNIIRARRIGAIH